MALIILPSHWPLIVILLFNSAGIGAGGAFLTLGSISTRLSALTDATLAVTPGAAQHAIAGHAGVCPGGAVTVFSLPAGVTLADSTAALPMIWKSQRERGGAGSVRLNLHHVTFIQTWVVPNKTMKCKLHNYTIAK